MSYKKAALVVDGIKYIYSVRENDYDISIKVYLSTDKTPYLGASFSYAEAWGINVYRPKTIEILIRFYQKHKEMFVKNTFRTRDYPELMELLMEYYFADSSDKEREAFVNQWRYL